MKENDVEIKADAELMHELWQELMKEKKLGIHDIKITTKEEDRKIIDYLKKNKTEETFAFSREEISKGTGIPINKLPYTSIVKIPNIEFILLSGKIWFVYITKKEKLMRLMRFIKII